jgi:thiol-disulfide isomerase/thioredoxin
MKNLILLAALAAGSLLQAQFTIAVEAPASFRPKEAILYSLHGSKDIIVSSETRTNTGWSFRMPRRYMGMMKIYFPETNASFNFISENSNIHIKLDATAEKVTNVIYWDEANRLMEQVQDQQKKKDLIFPALVQIKDYYRDDSEFGKALNREIGEISRKNPVDPVKNPFVSYYNINYNKFLVEQSTGTTPTQTEIAAFIENSGDMLETSSLLRPLLINYMNAGGNANVDASVDALLKRLNVETPRGQTVMSELIDIFDIYAMTALKEKYLTQAKNLKCTINDRLAATIKANMNVELGAVFPNYTFKAASNTKAKNLHEIKADRKVIVFWSSTCSHCEAELPKLLEKYNEMKLQNMEVIGLSLDTDQAVYKSKISALPWINDSELRGWNSTYTETYNVHATPTYFVLDSQNKIIARPDHVSDVLQFLKLK